MNEYEWPVGSLEFLETIRAECDASSALVFADFLEEQNRPKLVKIVKTIAKFLLPPYERIRKLRQYADRKVPTLVLEGTKQQGYLSRGAYSRRRQGAALTHYVLELDFTAVRTRNGWLRWKIIDTHNLPKSKRVKHLSHKLINCKPCAFADYLIKHKTLYF